MDQQQKMEALAYQNNLPLAHNDRLFHTKYLYRLSILMYAYKFPQLMNVPTIDENAYRVDSVRGINFIFAVRKYAWKHQDRTRLENKTLNYYTSDIGRLEEIIKYIQRLKGKETDSVEQMIEFGELKYFPGSVTERNIHYRKKRLPFGKFKFQILSERMDVTEYTSWKSWAEQYPNDIRLPNGIYNNNTWGTWAGEAIGYISTDKILQLIQFKLGSKINKIIEYRIKDNISK